MKYLFLLILLFTACTSHKIHPAKNDTLLVKKSDDLVIPIMDYYLNAKDTARYAFLKFNSNRDSSLFDKDSSPANLSGDEVTAIEKLINKQVIIYNRSRHGKYDSVKHPAKYYKQFITVVNSKKEKIVWVNCLCEVIRDRWKKYIPMVNDGGSYYFNLKINLTQNIVYYFRVNGLA
jgi:hypothetical protein